ncbi:MAG: hypothetical protein GY820_38825 [Gammaproteobacteria bacterium]|nr:hypothetical protein [Gammaproteobacteria bacterium]
MPETKYSSQDVFQAMFGKTTKPEKSRAYSDKEKAATRITTQSFGDLPVQGRYPGSAVATMDSLTTGLKDKSTVRGSGGKGPKTYRERIEDIDGKLRDIEDRAKAKVKDYDPLKGGGGFVGAKAESADEFGSPEQIYVPKYSDYARKEDEKESKMLKQDKRYVQEAHRTGRKEKELRKVVSQGEKIVEKLYETMPFDLSTQKGKEAFEQAANIQLEQIGLDWSYLRYMKRGKQ